MLSVFSLFGFYLLCIIGMWLVFEKAGKPGWKSIIPIYNAIILTDIIGKPRIWVLLLIIPILNVVFSIWMINLLSKSFGKGVGFTIGLIFLPFIFLLILGAGSAGYIGPNGELTDDAIDSIGSNEEGSDPDQRYMK